MTVGLEQLSAYFDGELAAEERRVVDAHLPGCADCRTALRHLDMVSRSLTATGVSRAGERRVPAAVLLGAAGLLLGSGIAIAGPFNEIFRSGNVSGVGSRAVSLEEARAASLPLPRTAELAGGWKVDQVQLVVTPTWRSVDVQYRRPGSRGMGITAWSQDIIVSPMADRREVVMVSGILVELAYSGESVSAGFTHGTSTVIIRAFADEVNEAGIRAVVSAWIERAR